MRCSPKGQSASIVLHRMLQLEDSSLDNIAVLLCSELKSCLCAGNNHILPSLVQTKIWTKFHQLRTRKDIVSAWKTFMAKVLKEELDHGCALFSLQVVLERGIKKLIERKVMHQQITIPSSDLIPQLTVTESNAVRYMSGYVAHKLMKRFRRKWKNEAVRKKYDYFVRVLERMRANHQLDREPESPLEYSTLWMELIDRGRLFHISDDVYRLFEEIEKITRKHLNTLTTHTDTLLANAVCDDLLHQNHVLDLWEAISEGVIPPAYEKYSIELYTHIIKVWIDIRVYSFTKEWAAKFERRRYEEGTRKSLKQKES